MIEKEEYAKWSTEKLLANIKLNKVVKATVCGICIVAFICFTVCFMYFIYSGEAIEENFWICILVPILVPIVIALYILGMFALFNLEFKRVKEELKTREYSKENEIAADIWLKKFYTTLIIVFVVGTVVSVGFALIIAEKEPDASKCIICGESASHSFQESSYCGEHYRDAIIWAFDNVSE
ncbi:MAG: hypothetical protein IJN48_01295 [Clostridia bacterium]|nr:hypothetical protein [Clostridia bacterium]